MKYLYQILTAKTNEWRMARYPCVNYPTISEILEYQFDTVAKTRVA
jgi:type III restriction enzyme